ncbi:hypothetical protein CAPTEDRAFT_198983 [Capitella teleta]|uniref:Sulfotransferase domain-containing protein n=1 Tax=Capitella teleta TaxID=283909 RepID=R7UI10_CAPTE|nr:hypothetical protein CAPTEDRAFT_198983 [Capitella teleta]|eukprot:ELU05855.1 hypothetical protein CAPTEDRAFT_198983 [Capitella teleta]
MMKEWQVRPSDVLLATPPKSGTTWMGEILRLMRGFHPQLSEDEDSEKLGMLPFLEMELPFLPMLFIKTHLPYEFTKGKVEQEGLKVIAVLREPKDTLTSLYYHYCLDVLGYPGDFHQFFELVRQDRLIGGNIFKMARDWWQARHLPNVLVVKYEEMKKDTAAVVRRVGEFLQIPLDDKAVGDIVQRCSMGEMRKSMADQTKDKNGKNFIDVNQFLRKGIIGDWKNIFNEDEVEFVDECVRKYYDPVGLDFNV